MIILLVLFGTISVSMAQDNQINSVINDINNSTDTLEANRVNHNLLDSSSKIWSDANKLYADNQYQEAQKLYSVLYRRGPISAELCYNLGNCYYRMDSVGQSVLWYSRALKIDPSDEDAQYNLLVAKQKVKDRIEPLPEFFVGSWLRRFGNVFSSNQWSMIALGMFTLVMLGVFVWFTSSRMLLRKVGFYGMLVVSILFVCSLSYAVWSYNNAIDNTRGVVISSSSVVKSSPSIGGKDLFVLHSGTDFRVIENLDGWSQITLADGSKGWISTKTIELI